MSKRLRPEITIKIPTSELDEGFELNSKRKTKRKRHLIKEYMTDYLTNSNLHGLKYIGEKERTCIEKFFWLFVFICCVVLFAGLIRKVWIKWNTTPVIVTLSENPTPVWEIPYPAVTICPETKAKQSIFNFTKYYHLYNDEETYKNLTKEEVNLFEDISMICDDHLAPPNGRKIANATELITNIKEVSPNITDIFMHFRWQGRRIRRKNYSDFISPIITEEGICYTFNILAAEELFKTENLHNDYQYLENHRKAESWNLDTGYAPGTPVETYPRRGLGFGVKSKLSFVLTSNLSDYDYICRGPIEGVKVLLHNPAELPRLSQQFFRVPLSRAVVVSVKPKMVTTSEELGSYDPERRQCYFPSKRYLQYFKVYTQANCQMECLSNFTFTRCGCVHFGMPHAQHIPVCGAGSVGCINSAQRELVSIEIKSGLDDETWDEEELKIARQVAQQCKCLPACTSIEYEAETSQVHHKIRASLNAYKISIPDDLDNISMSDVTIYFKEAQFIAYKRSELYGLTDFLANCGGLLGLFMGFSIMSVVEIFYFVVLRPCCLFHQRRNTRTSEPPRDECSKISYLQ